MRKIIDTHCHPYLNKDKDDEEIIENFFMNWWDSMIIVWVDLKSIKKALDLSESNKNIYVAIGIHPSDVYDFNIEEIIEEFEELYEKHKDKIVWIWETWLDYYRIYKDIHRLKTSLNEKERLVNEKKRMQEDFFKAQIEFAKKHDLPVIIHNRDASEELFNIIKKTGLKKFVMHCYSEDLEFAEKLIEYSRDCKISFSWIVTFENAVEIRDAAKNIPIEYILAETDSPYLTPSPLRWKEENEPLYTKYVIEEIAKIREEDLEYVEDAIYNNSKEFFRI